MWRRILSQKGIRVGQREFAKRSVQMCLQARDRAVELIGPNLWLGRDRNWKVLAVTVIVGCAVLVGEVAIMIPA